MTMNTKTRRSKELERDALGRLGTLAPGFELVEAKECIEPDEPRPDLIVDVRYGDKKKTLLVEIKSSGEPSSLYQSASRLRLASTRWPDSYPFVIAPYVSPRGREILRQSQVGFLDMLGNGLMQFDGIYFEGTEAAQPPRARRLQRSLFAPVSSGIQRVLLENPARRALAFLLILLIVLSAPPTLLWAAHTPAPSTVTVAGDFQSELGCPGDWQPDCSATGLALDTADAVWQGTFTVAAGTWGYKAALNRSWAENYGVDATANGPNVQLSLPAATAVKF